MDEPPVGEEARGAGDALAHAEAEVAADARQVHPTVELAAEAVDVEAEVLRPGDERAAPERALVLEERGVHLPEPALGAGRLGGLRGLERVGVRRRDREVAEDEPEPAAQRLAHRLDLRVRGAAVRALEVAVLDEEQRRVAGAVDVVLRPDHGLASTSASASRSSASSTPAAPGFTSIGERWLKTIVPLRSST